MGNKTRAANKAYKANNPQPILTPKERAERAKDTFFYCLDTFSNEEVKVLTAQVAKAYSEAVSKYKKPCVLIDCSFNVLAGTTEVFDSKDAGISRAWDNKKDNEFVVIFSGGTLKGEKQPDEGNEFCITAVIMTYDFFD
ncbi:MAG: hypothetical protein PUP93_32735 [Rhizonema sp. NSF051]|nr:hypothetical protein [Rhizonema sp. NSF051]